MPGEINVQLQEVDAVARLAEHNLEFLADETIWAHGQELRFVDAAEKCPEALQMLSAMAINLVDVPGREDILRGTLQTMGKNSRPSEAVDSFLG
jgi:hypothetical protein